jgi:hypothetical protein
MIKEIFVAKPVSWCRKGRADELDLLPFAEAVA